MIGVIGGTGLYNLENSTVHKSVNVRSPFGQPSDSIVLCSISGIKLAFLARHGRGHCIPPSEVNYRANIDSLKRIGVNKIIAFNAVGSLNENWQPGSFAVIDQYIDFTFARQKSFFSKGLVAHVSMAEPTCNTINQLVISTAKSISINAKSGATYIAIEGPQFSTRAESLMYNSLGGDVIGMTGMPEAKLAKEAEICYTSVALVTDYDCWNPNYKAVTAKSVIQVLHENTTRAKSLLSSVLPEVNKVQMPCASGCQEALEHAITTSAQSRDVAVSNKLSAVAGRVIGNAGWYDAV